MAPDFSHNKGLLRPIYKTVVPMKIYPLRHGVSFHPSLSFFSFCIPLNDVRKPRGVDRDIAHLTYYITQKAVFNT